MRPVRIASKGSRVRALAVIATAALLTISFGAGVASADGGRDHRNAENTFTKWRTAEPPVAPVLINMAGVVGGDVGDGTFTGEVLSYTPGATTVIEALYHFHGSRHSFTASVHVEQTGPKAVISGVVTNGWLKGNLVEAGYTQITCNHDGTSTDCFRGWLDILRGSKSGD